MNWFTNLRILAEAKKSRMALERIATSLEELLLRQGSPNSLRSFYKAGRDDVAEVIESGDEYFAEQERLEQERAMAGGGDDE